MHELLLFAQVPSSRYIQVLNILAGVSAMQPVPLLEKHLVFKPNRNQIVGGTGSGQTAVGGKQDVAAQKQMKNLPKGDLFYLKVVGEKAEDEKLDGVKFNSKYYKFMNRPLIGSGQSHQWRHGC